MKQKKIKEKETAHQRTKIKYIKRMSFTEIIVVMYLADTRKICYFR